MGCQKLRTQIEQEPFFYTVISLRKGDFGKVTQEWLSVDPLADDAPGWTPYRYCFNNPINLIDPNGMSEGAPSTHTDENGNVLAVYNDGDKGVYKHNGAKNASDIDAARKTTGTTSGGGQKMGETEHWDEFASPETGKTMTNYQIQFGKSFDPIIQSMHQKTEDMDLKEIASESGGNGLFDIKKDYKNVGALLNGKYATSRSAGNFLAGFNAATGTYFGGSISFETFQKLAGALHVMESRGLRLNISQKMDIVLFGTHCGKAPAYGEQMYQYRMSKAGWDKSKLMH